MESGYSKCPNCEGRLEYRADHRMFGCESCQSFFSDEQIKKLFKGRKSSGSSAQSGRSGSDEDFCRGSLWKCPGCGARFMSGEGKNIRSCVYCHSTPERSGDLPYEYRPGRVIPFGITRDRAAEILTENIGGRKFTPSDLTSGGVLENFAPVYVPLWLADSEADIRMNGTGNMVRKWEHGGYNYTETKEFAVERKAGADFTDVPSVFTGEFASEGCGYADDYDFSKMEPFKADVLLSYPAEYCDADKGAAFGTVRRKITAAVRNALQKSVSDYSDFSAVNEDIDILRTEWGYTLVPVWVLSYSLCGREFRFTVNGQTGKFRGNPPLSPKKITLFAVLTVLVITGLWKLAEMLFGFAGTPGSSGYLFRSLGAGFCLGAAVSAVSCFMIRKKYTAGTEPGTDDYAGEEEIRFTARSDRYVRQFTTKVKNEE